MKDMDAINEAVSGLVHRLLAADRASHNALLHAKTDKALANIKRARTYLEKADQTLMWAEYQNKLNEITKTESNLV